MNKQAKQKARQGRLSQALKDNLKRRKQQPAFKTGRDATTPENIQESIKSEKESEAPMTPCE